jgi:hypothetical protein
MKDLLKETIPGASFNSSTRYPPPRCHLGTRLTILERCLVFIARCNGMKKIFWVFGAAGVGKSAIMQNVAESPSLPVASHASIFFSVFGRNDTTKAVVTISYQLAVQSEVYRRFVEDEIARDPSLLQSSMPVQFNTFIVAPFIHNAQLNSTGRVLIIIDGLDECNYSHTQTELLRLISDFCIAYPSSPIAWLITSRPELHITSFFSRPQMAPVYEKEEILVDSNQARADVERYLRDELMEIKRASDALDSDWPEERDCWKLANAAGGLFAYAHTAINYIGDSTVGSPASQLSDVLNVIDRPPMTDVPREEHPLALLDALYARILSKTPSKIMLNTRKLLLALATHWVQYLWYNDVGDLILLCNWLGMTPDDAYAALNHLRSVLRVPGRDKAYEEMLEPFHKSFIDYISDFTRSGFSADVKADAQRITTRCALRILKEAPDGVDFGDTSYGLYHGTIGCGPGTGDNISLTWLADGKGGWSDDETRLKMYKLAIGEVVKGVIRGDPTFQNEFCIRVLTTRFRYYNPGFPYYQLCESVFVSVLQFIYLFPGLCG